MATPTILDAVVLAPAVVLGLLGVWLGFVRSWVAWPMRWVLPLFGAYLAGRLAEIGLLIVWTVAGLAALVGPPVTWAAFIVALLAAFVPLLMFMENLTDRVAVWTAGRRVGLAERVLGGLFGAACGLVVAAIAIEHAPLRRAAADEPAWVRESALLPWFRGAAEAAENALALALRDAAGPRRR